MIGMDYLNKILAWIARNLKKGIALVAVVVCIALATMFAYDLAYNFIRKDENVASMITLSEESRRMQEMMKMYGMSGMDPSMFGTNATLILNANHPLVEYVVAHKDGENTEMFCHQLYDLAMLAHKPLSPEEMTEFVKRSNEIMMKLAK